MIEATHKHEGFSMPQDEVPMITGMGEDTGAGKPPVLAPEEEPKRRKKLPIILIALFVVLATAAGIRAYVRYRDNKVVDKPAIKVGVLMAFTGGSSNMGYGTMKGIQLAKKQLGADNIQLIQADSQCSPKTAKVAMQSLIDQGVVAVIGDGCSSASLAALTLANSNKIPMVSPSASSTALSIANDYFFRVVPSDNYQAAYIAQAIRKKGITRVAVFYTNEPYGSAMNKSFQEQFQTLGGTVVATAYAEPDDINLATEMQKLKAASPQAVFIAPNSLVTGTAAMQVARDQGIAAPLFGGDILYDKTLITNAPAASAGLTLTTFPTGSAAFKQQLVNEYKVSEQLYAAPQAYDAFEAIYRALEKGATTGETIRSTLPSLSFKGMSANISFDQNGEEPGVNYKYDLLQVKGGAFTTLDQ
jgi:branched-chain amino acid transport system substrate-binding protein